MEIKSPFANFVGIKTADDGRTVNLQVQPSHANSFGFAHGGAIFTLADHAFARTVNSEGGITVAMEMKINFLVPVKVGDVLTAEGKIVKSGRSTKVCIIEVKRENELIAIVLATGFNVE